LPGFVASEIPGILSMLRRRIYYTLKPFIPWRLRATLRRAAVNRKRPTVQAVWPIDPASARRPADWPGWPNGKRFAFVLSHDVEGPDGQAKCRQLAEVEMALGCRSSFNLIPEGDYAPSAELRAWLKEKGFEVGIHDLHHDGKLYWSRSGFRRNAQRINRYAEEWGAVGFRSGFMLHELDWIHDLNIDYDASTFDTDPFEPQPDPAGTIFPFWVPRPGGNPNEDGYVELPYSLPQDSTLFLFLRETSPEIWLRKLDWVADQGGMALVNVHPDYLRFEGERPASRTFPVAYYQQLLEHVRRRYGDSVWHPLPKELAAWYRSAVRPAAKPAAIRRPRGMKNEALRGKRAAVLLYSYYPSDSRPRRAATAMVEAGMSVDLFCLKDGEQEKPTSVEAGVNVFRLPMQHSRGSKLFYFLRYGRFLLSSFLFLFRRGFRRPYDIVHVHNMPDILVFSAALQKFRGAGIVLDLHDPMPELMTSIYDLKADNWQIRLLRRLETWSIGLSDLVLTPNIAFRNLFVSRGCPPGKIEIVMNSPEEEIFDLDRFGAEPPRKREGGEFRIMHHGSIVYRHGIDLLVEAVARVREAIPGIRLDIYGRHEPFLDTVLATAKNLGIAELIRCHGEKTAVEIRQAIRETDLGVIPNRRSVFTDLNFPTRILEFLAMNRPVVAPATQGIKDYFGPDEMLTFEQGNVDDLAARIRWVWENPEKASVILEGGRRVCREHSWSGEKARFLSEVAALAASD
jgi:glycosyltransferase involved in cell wall biosynthesis